jgi:ubiquinone/menaquinone biosynthesis C-methylase UbiE
MGEPDAGAGGMWEADAGAGSIGETDAGASPTASPHAQRLQEAFSRQAAAFEDTRLNRVFTLDAEWLLAPLSCRPQDLLLDVAAGTGHAARSLAPRVHAAVAVDVTAAMLQAGKARADEQGLRNVVFQHGDALALPFLDGTFDVVLSRFATHHIEQPERQLAEMTRCLRPGGRLALADMVCSENPQIARAQNRLERVRDPSHTRMLSCGELVALLGALGLDEITTEVRQIDRPLQPWLELAQADKAAANAVRDELLREIAGGEATGLDPYEREGELRFCQTWACALAVKPRVTR